jgi:ethanolamine utilization protein EutA (predicted chaperonin)
MSDTDQAHMLQAARTAEEDGNRVDFVGADAGPDEASIPGKLSDGFVEAQRRPGQSLDLPVGLGDVAGAVLVADAQELVRSRCCMLDLDVGIRLLSGDTNRRRSMSVDRGRLVRDGPWLQIDNARELSEKRKTELVGSNLRALR